MASKKSTSTSKKGVATPKSTAYNKVSLTNLIGTKLKLQGSVSGKSYTWESGATVEVDARDAPAFLEKKLGEKHCCGGSPNKLFEIKIGD